MQRLLNDIRSAWRTLAQAPGLAIGVVAALTLGGLGANPSILGVAGPGLTHSTAAAPSSCEQSAPKARAVARASQPECDRGVPTDCSREGEGIPL